MKNIWRKYWPYLVVLALWVLAAVLICSCDRRLKKENERYIKGFKAAGERVVLVGLNHAQTILGLARSLSYRLPTKK